MDTAKKYLWQGLSPLDVPTDDPISETSSNNVVQLLSPSATSLSHHLQ